MKLGSRLRGITLGLRGRLFVWFLLALTVSICAAGFPWLIAETTSRDDHIEYSTRSQIVLTRDLTERLWALDGGKEALEPILLPQLKQKDASLAVISASGEVLLTLGSPAEPAVPLLTDAERRAILAEGELVYRKHGHPRVFALSMILPNDERGIFYMAIQQPEPDLDPGEVWGGLGSFLLLLIVGWLSSWPLASYLSKPMRELAATAGSLGAGDLDARVTVRRRDEIGQLGEHFNRMAARLQQMVVTHKRLLADVSHELRSPLARIKVAVELARQDAGDHPSPFLTQLDAHTDALAALVDELLVYSRLDVKPDTAVFERIEPIELFEQVVAERGDAAKDRKLAFQLRVAPDLPPMTADPRLLARALGNVVANSLAFAPEGSAIELAATAAGGRFQLTVMDHGPGVPPDQLDKIFEPFYRVEASRSRDHGGVGLGLAITRRCMEAHQGGAYGEGVDGSGLRVVLWFPVGLV